jgi:hypothetical protein
VVVATGVAVLGATIVSARRHTLGLPQPA